MPRQRLTDERHEQVTRIAYPAALLVHLHEAHGVDSDSLQGRSPEWLGVEHTKRHEMLLHEEMKPEVSPTPNVDALADLIVRVHTPEPEPLPTSATLDEVSELTKRIRRGEFDRFIEDILAATHGRKNDRRAMRRGR